MHKLAINTVLIQLWSSLSLLILWIVALSVRGSRRASNPVIWAATSDEPLCRLQLQRHVFLIPLHIVPIKRQRRLHQQMNRQTFVLGHQSINITQESSTG